MKDTGLFICSKCDAQFPKWSGRCLECGAWGSLSQLTAAQMSGKNKKTTTKPAEVIDLNTVVNNTQPKLTTGVEEIDRVFGSGLTVGSLTLLGGEPGIGKSTLVAQIADLIGRQSQVLYVSGEESATQVKTRLERLNCQPSNLKFISETNMETIIATARSLRPALVIIDSIQTVALTDLPSESGSVSQIRAAAASCLELAKNDGITVILIGHITKDGSIAGPKTLEHIVDTVVYLETDPSQNYRFLRATKNRFGSTNELGIFTMTAQGLIPAINPTGLFLANHTANASGSAVSAIIEGTRPFLLEIQALVSKTVFGYPVRRAAGFDLNRLQVLTTVLSKRGQINLNSSDVILNIVGGLKINDPGLDLAVCAAIISSFLNKAIDKKTLILGEVGLSGEVRPVSRLEDKIKEAAKLGFQQALAPTISKATDNIHLIQINDLRALTDWLK